MSTAAGNHGANVSIDGRTIGTGSGMAPGAKIAAYKDCWEGRPGFGSGCFNSDSIAAINDSMRDGVDVGVARAVCRASDPYRLHAGCME